MKQRRRAVCSISWSQSCWATTHDTWESLLKGTGSIRLCKLAFKTIVEREYYFPMARGYFILHNYNCEVSRTAAAFIALCTEQMNTLRYTMVLKASLHELLDPVPLYNSLYTIWCLEQAWFPTNNLLYQPLPLEHLCVVSCRITCYTATTFGMAVQSQKCGYSNIGLHNIMVSGTSMVSCLISCCKTECARTPPTLMLIHFRSGFWNPTITIPLNPNTNLILH